jgi:putative flippase GtrA
MITLKKLASHPLYLKHKEFVKFFIVGVANTLLDFLLFGLFANVVGIFPVVANILSTAICMCVSFALNSKFVWKTKRSIRETAPKFFAVTIFTAWVVQGIVIFLITSFFPRFWILENEAILNMIAKICASGAGMIVNFFGYRLIFKEKKNQTVEIPHY